MKKIEWKKNKNDERKKGEKKIGRGVVHLCL